MMDAHNYAKLKLAGTAIRLYAFPYAEISSLRMKMNVKMVTAIQEMDAQRVAE